MRFLNWGNWLIIDFWTLIPLMIFALFYAYQHPKSLITVYGGLSIVIAIVSLGHVGSSQIYMFESIFAIAIMAPLGFPEALKQKQRIGYVAIAVVLPLMALFSNSLMYFSTPDYARSVKLAEAIISDAEYPILTENANMVLDAGKTPYLCDPFVFMNLTAIGTWDEKPLIDDLNNQKIPYVITQLKLPAEKIKRFNTNVQNAILANYDVILDCSEYPYGFVVYVANNHRNIIPLGTKE